MVSLGHPDVDVHLHTRGYIPRSVARAMTDRRAFALIAATLLVVYLVTASPYLGLADSPEFAALYALGGVAHPPGYPTAVVAYRLLSWLPAPAAHGASLATAIYGALTALVLCFAARDWGASRSAAAAGALIVGLSSQVWLHHTAPEAFAIANLFAALIVWVASPNATVKGATRVALLGVLAGLALGAHHSLVLLAPLGLYAVLRAARQTRRPVVSMATGAAGLVAGLSIYGYCLIARSPVGLGRAQTLGDLVDLFLRRDYGTTRLGVGGAPQPLEHIVFFVSETAADLGFVGAILLIVGVVATLRAQTNEGANRALALSWLLIGPLFVMMFNTTPQGPQAEIARRFHALPLIVATPMIARGIDILLQHEAISVTLKRVIAVVTVLLVVGTGATRVSRLHRPTMENYLRNTLEHLPEDAIIFAEGDHRTFGWQYLQHVEGMRPDVVHINPGSLARAWLVADLEQQLGFDLPDVEPDGAGGYRFDLNAVVDELLEQTQRPVFVVGEIAPTVFGERSRVPEGVAWRLLRDGESPPSAAQLTRRTAKVFEAFRHVGPTPTYVDEPWAWTVHNTWTTLWSDLHRRCIADADPCADTAQGMLDRYPDL